MFSNGGSTSPVRSWLATLIVSVILAFTAGFMFGHPSNGFAAQGKSATSTKTGILVGVGTGAPSDVVPPVDFNEFWELWRLLKSKYYIQPIDEKKLFYGAMSGMAASLGDPYTVFFEPKNAEEFSNALQGKFEGIGAEIGIKDDQLQVIAPLDDSPAEKAGLLAGDLILAIDTVDTLDMSVEKAVSLIRGDKGTKVTLKIGRYATEKDAKGKEKKTPTITDVVIVRDAIIVKSVRIKYQRDGIALVEINHFNQDTATLFSAAVDEVLAKDVKGIILDLRNNPGGYLDRATAVAGEWVGDQIVVQERQQGKITEKFKGMGSGRLRDIPTVVLVDQGSASASEIVAGALQDYKKAQLVGMKTFGKGSVQDYIDFPDKGAVKITIAEWLTPLERSINNTGVEPDVQVDRTQEDFHANRDPQLDKALEILTGTSSTAPTAKTP